MRKIKLINIIVILCIFAVLLSSCSKKLSVKDSGGAYYDKKEDVKYTLASPCYEPMLVKEDIYAKSGKIEFHEIIGADPLKWLCQTNGAVFYAEGVELPSLEEMSISVIDVMQDEMLIGTISDKERIKSIMDTYLTGDSIEYYNYEPKLNLSVKFADSTLGIYYSISYIEYAEDYIVEDDNGNEYNYGKSFLYDIYNGIFVPSDGLTGDIGYYGAETESDTGTDTE